MTNKVDNKIVKSVDLKAPIAKVWQAITDYREFSAWFLVDLEGPFTVGEITRGVITHPECAGQIMTAVTTRLDPPHHFAFHWPPDEFFVIDDPQKLDGTTLVEFELEEIDCGTRLTVTESGIDELAVELRAKVLESNTEGWEHQLENIRKHLEGLA